LPIDALALYDDVNCDFQEFADVGALQVLSALRFLYEKSQLFKRQLRRVSVHGRDRAGMPGVYVTDVIESRPIAQLLQKDSIGPHAQTGFQKFLRTDSRKPLASLRIEQRTWFG